MNINKLCEISEVKWEDVREAVTRVNPTLSHLIEQLNPGMGHVLYKASYPYGSNIIEKGVLMLPTSTGVLATIHDKTIPASIRKNLSYSSIPVGIWLNTCAEVFVEREQRIIPLNIFQPGAVFGLWEVLDPPISAFSQRIWSVAAGSRSVFMLPKITDSSSHARLEKMYKLRSSAPPKNLLEHAKLFAQITNSPEAQADWRCEVLFFSNEWFQEKTDSKEWLRLHYYLLKNEWSKSIFWRNKVTFELIGQTFAAAQASKNLKASPYLIDTVMHLISLGIGSSPGFEPVTDNELSAPISAIQKAFIDCYGLKFYSPTIMQPAFLSTMSNLPIYYSLQSPTLLASSPKSNKSHSVLDDLRMVKRLLEALFEKIKTDNFPIYDLIKNIQYEFFHTEPDSYLDIQSTNKISTTDSRFIANQDRIFCETNSFMRGCVRISVAQDSLV